MENSCSHAEAKRRRRKQIYVGGGISAGALATIIILLWLWLRKEPTKTPDRKKDDQLVDQKHTGLGNEKGSKDEAASEEKKKNRHRKKPAGRSNKKVGGKDLSEHSISENGTGSQSEKIETNSKTDTSEVEESVDQKSVDQNSGDQKSGDQKSQNSDDHPEGDKPDGTKEADSEKQPSDSDQNPDKPDNPDDQQPIGGKSPFLKKPEDRVTGNDSKLFGSLKKQLIKKAREAFKKPCDEGNSLKELFESIQNELKLALKADANFKDSDVLSITAGTALKGFLKECWVHFQNDTVNSYDKAFKELCEKNKVKDFEALHEAWRSWLKFLSVNVSSDVSPKSPWLSFQPAEASEWCKSQYIPEHLLLDEPLSGIPKFIEVKLAKNQRIVFGCTHSDITRDYRAYVYESCDYDAEIESIEFLGRKFTVSKEDSLKHGYSFETDCRKRPISLTYYGHQGFFVYPISLIKSVEFTFSSYETIDRCPYFGKGESTRRIAITFKNFKLSPIPDKEIIIRPAGLLEPEPAENLGQEVSVNRLLSEPEVDEELFDYQKFEIKTEPLVLVDTVKNQSQVKYYFSPFKARHGVEICGRVFALPWYVNRCEGVVLEAKVNPSLLSKPPREFKEHFFKFTWTFYKSDNPGNYFILSFVADPSAGLPGTVFDFVDVMKVPGSISVSFANGTKFNWDFEYADFTRFYKSYVFGSDMVESEITSVTFFGKTYDIPKSDSKKLGYAFDTDIKGSSVTHKTYETERLLPLPASSIQNGALQFTYSSYDKLKDCKYLCFRNLPRKIAITFNNFHMPIPYPKVFPIRTSGDPYSGNNIEVKMAEKIEWEPTISYDAESVAFVKTVKTANSIKHYFKPFSTRSGVEVCGYLFIMPYYVDLVNSAVLEATIDPSWLKKPIEELVKHFGIFDWKFYKSEEEEGNGVFIVSFVSI